MCVTCVCAEWVPEKLYIIFLIVYLTLRFSIPSALILIHFTFLVYFSSVFIFF